MKSFMLILLVSVANAFSAQAQTKKTETVSIHTSARCEMCKQTIESALYKVQGVVSANLDLETKNVTVVYRPAKTTADALRKAISGAGYDADEVAADPNAYENLNGCCRKDGDAH
jgi:copper chaperone CopZ